MNQERNGGTMPGAIPPQPRAGHPSDLIRSSMERTMGRQEANWTAAERRRAEVESPGEGWIDFTEREPEEGDWVSLHYGDDGGERPGTWEWDENRRAIIRREMSDPGPRRLRRVWWKRVDLPAGRRVFHMTADEEGKWISMSDREPDEGQVVAFRYESEECAFQVREWEWGRNQRALVEAASRGEPRNAWWRPVDAPKSGRRPSIVTTDERGNFVVAREPDGSEFVPLSERRPEPWQLVVMGYDAASFGVVEYGDEINPQYYDHGGVQFDCEGEAHPDDDSDVWRPATPADLADYDGEWVESGGKCWVAAKWIPFADRMPDPEGLIHFSDDGCRESGQLGAHSPGMYDRLGGGYWCYAEDRHRLPERGGGGVA